MSQTHVEQVIGRLATDEQWRAAFRRGPGDALDALIDTSVLELTPTERRALLALAPDALDRFAAALDPRLQRLEVLR
ncbi:Os1348 family NHLP clan protein [Luteitalea sp.]|jgi:hypothetical protein|uniref:Os1348 family NHLP clan protein n=1 Tax=Luteitalea sp. TaxID=2004800 RepID=UPI0037CAF687